MKKIQIMKNLKQKRFKNKQSKILGSRFKLKQLKKKLPRIKTSRLESRLKKKKIKQLRPGLPVPVLRFFNKKKLVSKGFLKSVASLHLLKKTSVYWKKKLNNFSKFFFYLSIKALVSVQAYKLFILMELQLNIVLSKAQLVPFFFFSYWSLFLPFSFCKPSNYYKSTLCLIVVRCGAVTFICLSYYEL